MKLKEFLERIEDTLPKIVHFSALHMLKKVYNIQEDSLTPKELKAFFINYNLYQRYLNDYAGVIYNQFESSIDEVYKVMCEYFKENPDNQYLFEYRITRISNQDPTKYLSIPDPEMRNAAIARVEDKIEVIEESTYYKENKKEADIYLNELKQSLSMVKKAVGIV
ncbi:MAG: hypothetical protein ACNI3C_09940 [Candidatus Marinarcus sp.]|uniref:hypothetical protein n=1 Tax=Candidatus Marinarcus sp. TaxID=3100987 RepID=UPI003B008F13